MVQLFVLLKSFVKKEREEMKMRQKSILRKIAAGVAVFAMAFSMLSPVSVKAAEKVSYPEKQVVYQTNKNGGGSVYFSINNIPKGQKVLKVTSSKNSVAKPYYIYESNNDYSEKYLDKEMSQYNYSGVSRYAEFGLRAFKKGTATISYRIGKSDKSYKTYKTKLSVYAYENPIESLTITGVNSGKNLASAFKTSNSPYEKTKPVTKNQSNGKITVRGNTNWKITNINFSNDYDNSYMYISYPQNAAKSKVTLPVGKLKAGKSGYVHINLYNTKTGGTQRCTYHIAGNVN